MLRPARFHRDVDRCIAEIDSVVGPVVRGLYDIRPMIRENSGEPVQSTGIVRKVNPQPYQPSIFDQAAFDDAREQCHINVSAAHQHRHSLVAQRQLAIQHGRDGCRSRPFGQRLLALQQQQNGVGNLLFFHRDDVVHVLLHQRQRLFSSAAHRDSVGNGLCRFECYWLSLRYRGFHRRNPRRLHAIHLHLGIRFLHRAGDTADQPASPDRRHDDLDVRML